MFTKNLLSIKIVVFLILIFILVLNLSCKGKTDSIGNINNKINSKEFEILTPDKVSAVGINSEVIIYWNNLNNATSYNIYWSTKPNVNKINAEKIIGLTHNSFVHEGLANGVSYYYVITAVYDKKESDESTEINATPNKEFNIILDEDFESNRIDPRILIKSTGSFEQNPKIKNILDFGSKKSFGFGRAKTSKDSILKNTSSLKISLLETTYIVNLSFDEMELNGNNGSSGSVYINGKKLLEKFGRVPENDNISDTQFRTRNYLINQNIKEIEIKVDDIKNESEIFIDNLKIAGKHIFLKTNVTVKAGGSHNLILKSDKKISAWGKNENGQLGDSTNIDRVTPAEVKNFDNIKALAIGNQHSLALNEDNNVLAWGENLYGQLGDNTNADKNIPVKVKDIIGIVSIAGGGSHSLALKNDGIVWVWGNNGSGQLGNDAKNYTNTPVAIKELINIAAIAGGGSHSLALKSDGTVWTCGANSDGQLGDSTKIDKSYPVEVKTLNTVKAIAGGGSHSLALKRDGTVWAWGNIGYNNYTFQTIPIQIVELKNIIAIAGGGSHSLALKSDGTVWAWGNNGSGQLGDETYLDKKLPVQVSGLSDVVLISAGDIHSLALKSDGSIWVWGNNGFGQLSKNNLFKSSKPIQVEEIEIVLLAPYNVSAKAGDQEVIINWETKIDLTYNIYWSTSAGVTKNNGTKIANVASPYKHEDLTNGTTYYYVVTSENSYGESVESNQVSLIPNAPPLNLENVLIAAGDKQISVIWENKKDLTYNIYWSTSAGVTKNNGTKIANVASPYKHEDLANGVRYYYVVTAENVYGESVDSNQVDAVPNQPPVRPENVLLAAGDKQVSISWYYESDIIYNIYWSTSAGVTKNNGTKISNIKSPYVHTNLVNGVKYYYVLIAEKNNIESVPSKEVNTIPILVLQSPNNVFAEAGDKKVVINWDTDSSLIYNIYWLTSAGVTKNNGTKILNVKSPYTHANLANGNRYYYILIAEKNIVESPSSKEVNASPNIPPTAPVNLSTSVLNEQVKISWETDSTLIYNIYWSTSSGVNKRNGTKISNVKSPYIHKGLIKEKAYYYVVTAERYEVESSESKEITIFLFSVPAKPTGVLLDPGDKQLTIKWDKAKDLTYNIYWSVSADVTKNNGTKISNVVNPYIHISLNNGTKYYYVVTAENIYGESLESNQVLGIPNIPPSSPVNVVAMAGNKQITISWNKETGLIYNIYWATGAGVNKNNEIKITNATSPYIHTNLSNEVTYYYVVTAVSLYGESAKSREAVASPYIVPINILTVTRDKQITISWDKVSGLTYNIYWATSAGVNKNNGTKIANVANPYIHSNLTNGITYYYVITAENIYAESNESAQISAAPNIPPISPTGIQTLARDKQITISWSKKTSLIYNIYWSVNSGVNKNNGIKISNAVSPYVHISLLNGTTYYYVVTAENNYGESNESEQVSAVPNIPPSSPVNELAVAGNKQITISWNKETGLVYNLYWATGAGVNKNNGTKIGNVTSPYINIGLVNTNIYYYVITAESIYGESVESKEVSSSPYVIPTNMSKLERDKQITISWDKVSGLTYNIYWSNSAGVNKNNGTKIANVVSPYPHTGLINGNTYYYVVTSQNAFSESTESAQISAVPNTPPLSPSYIEVIAGDKQIEAIWSIEEGVTYNLYWSIRAGVNKSNGMKISNVKSSYIHTSLTFMNTYYYVVTAENSFGESEESEEVSAAPYEIPKNISIINLDKQITISWDTSANLKYNLYWSTADGVNKNNGTKIPNVKSPFIHTDLTNGNTYYYIITSEIFSVESLESKQVNSTPNNLLNSKVASGNRHSILLKENKTVWTWGYNGYGQLGEGTKKDRGIPIQVSELTNVKSIAAGANHSLALNNNGIVWAWGNNFFGQLGNRTTSNSSTPVQVSGLTNVKEIAGGYEHSIALKNDGTVWAWGSNSFGQLGDKTNTTRSIPVQVSGLTNVLFIAGREDHSLALKNDGTVWAWGNNENGQLGDGTIINRSSPVQVLDLTNVLKISSGDYYCMALKSDGTIWAWGSNSFGQLGDGTTTDRRTPVEVLAVTDVISIIGGGNHSLAIKSNGTVWAWGNNSDGQLGNGTTNNQSTPIQITGIINTIEIAAGDYHSLILKNDGTVWAWGENWYGQLGDRIYSGRNTPVQVKGAGGEGFINAGN